MASTPPTDPASLDRRRQAEQAVFMREVDEAVRQDEMSSAARKYGVVVILALLAVLLVFGGWLIWHNRQESRLEQRSEELVQALDELEAGNVVRSDDALEALLADAPPAGAAASRLLRAAIAMQQNRLDEAVALFDEVAADGDAPRPYRDLAAVRAVSLSYDRLQPQQVIDRLGPLAVPENAWFGSAGELVAMAHLAQDRRDQAGPLLVAVAQDERVPQTLRARTRQLAGLLGYDAVEDVEETLAQLAEDGTVETAAPLANPAEP